MLFIKPALSHYFNFLKLEINCLIKRQRPRSIFLWGIAILLVSSLQLKGFENLPAISQIFLTSVNQTYLGIFYCQFLFSWNSDYFDSIISAPFEPKVLIVVKIVVTQILIIIGFCLNLPLLLIHQPELFISSLSFTIGYLGLLPFLGLAFAFRESPYYENDLKATIGNHKIHIFQILKVLVVLGLIFIYYLINQLGNIPSVILDTCISLLGLILIIASFFLAIRITDKYLKSIAFQLRK